MLEEALYWGSVERLKPCFVGAVEMRPPSFLLWPPAAVMELPLKLVKMSSVFSKLILVIMLHHDRKVTNTVLCFTSAQETLNELLCFPLKIPIRMLETVV